MLGTHGADIYGDVKDIAAVVKKIPGDDGTRDRDCSYFKMIQSFIAEAERGFLKALL